MVYHRYPPGMVASSSLLASSAGVYWVETGGGAQIDKGEKGWDWLHSPLASVSCLYLAIAQALLLALSVWGNGDALWANGRVTSPSSSTVEATTSCRTNWAVRGNWADTGDLNALESFSLHSVT